MTLRRRTFAYMTILLICMIVILFLALQNITLSSFEAVEREQVLHNINGADYSLQEMRDSLFSSLRDWSNWTEVYDFVQTSNPVFVEENLRQGTFDALDISFMLFLDAEDVEVYWLTQLSPEVDSVIHNALSRDDELYTVRNQLLANSPIGSFAVIEDVPLILAARPILRSDDSGPAVGTLIWGKTLNSSVVDDLAARFSAVITISTIEPNAEQPERIASEGPWLVMTETSIMGCVLLPALGGTLELALEQPRLILQQARRSVFEFTLALLIFGAVVIGGVLLLLDRLVLARVKRLSDAVEGVGKAGAMRPILVEGRDELSILTRSINTMLKDVATSRSDLESLNAELEQRVAQRTIELEVQQAQFRAILDTMGEGLIYTVDNEMLVVNPALAELVGFKPEELIGQSFKTLTPKTDITLTQYLLQKPDRCETTLIRRDGTTVEVAITVTPVQMNDGKKRRVIIVRDITQEAEMKRQRDYFFARASHELRTPLSNIMTRLYLLERDPEQSARHLDVLNKVSRHMLNLLNDLLAVARLKTGLALDKHPLDLKQVLEEVVEIQQSDADLKRIDIKVRLPDAPLQVFADQTRITQALTNTIRNAVVYTPEAGKIDVDAEIHAATNEVCIRVRDNGIGIDPAHIPHLFDPFFRVVEGGVGAGLGLYITREIIELHDGEIYVESEAGMGTTFCIRLGLYPIHDPTPTP